MNVIYGEGSDRAFARLRMAIAADEREETRLLEKLGRVGGAYYDSDENKEKGLYVENTRVEILQQIDKWAKQKNSRSIFWLSGVAGAGKSTIATQAASSYQKSKIAKRNADSYQRSDPRRILTFFFRRKAGDASRSRKLVSTLAYQLAKVSPQLQQYICYAIKQDENLGWNSNLSKQMDELLLEPLRKWRKASQQTENILLVVDALDECEDKNDITTFVQLLGDAKDLPVVGLRVLLTSRPDTEADYGLRCIANGSYEKLTLHKIAQKTVDADIKTFLIYRLNKIKQKLQIPDPWPGEDRVETLTKKASGLFIFAATVCKYVDIGSIQPTQERLEEVCEHSGSKHESVKGIDEMYELVLSSSLTADYEDAEIRSVTYRTRRVTGSILVLFDSLSISTLGTLLDHDPSAGKLCVDDVLNSLQAVMYTTNGRISIMHETFRDFLLSDKRCTDPRFAVNAKDAHYDLGLQCFRVMEEHLHENMCWVPPGTYVSDIKRTQINSGVPPAVRYACQYWLEHALEGQLELRDDGTLHSFLKTHSLYYFEAMGLIGKIRESQLIFRRLKDSINSQQAPLLHKLAHDLVEFISTCSEVAAIAPLQVYYVAAHFSPCQSAVRNISEIRSIPRYTVSTQSAHEWDSNNIFKIASELQEGSLLRQAIRMYFPRTEISGEPFAWVKTMAMSPDGLTVASGSDDLPIRIWNADNGRCRRILNGGHGVDMLVLSPDGLIIASHDSDTVKIWDLETGECRNRLAKPPYRICSIAFSSNGSTLTAFGFRNEILRMWDAKSGECHQKLENWLPWFDSAALSPDGSTVASGSLDHMVRIWNVKTGKCLKTLEGHLDRVISTAFSLDGLILVSSSKDCTVRIWEVKTGKCRQWLQGHSNPVISVLFSPDGLTLASGSRDRMIRIWSTRTGECLQSLAGHHEPVTGLLFSSDGYTLVSNSPDWTVRAWDVKTGKCRQVLTNYTGSTQESFQRMRPSANMYSITRDGWVTCSSNRRIWLPPTFRPGVWQQFSETVCIGGATGKVTIIHFS